MSLDVSSPEVSGAINSIANKSAAWLLLSYASPTTPAQIKLYSTGTIPVVRSLRECLENTSEDVLFGYGVVDEKGLVLVYLTANVGGVRRARAIVHSRAIAQQFPDHQALLTISHPSQLTEDLVNEKLGLNYNGLSPTAVAPMPMMHQSGHQPTSSTVPIESSPSNPTTTVPSSVSRQFSDSSYDDRDNSLTMNSVNHAPVAKSGLSEPEDRMRDVSLHDQPSHLAPPMLGGHGPPLLSDGQVNAQSVHNPDFRPEQARNRSLSSRFKGLPFRTSPTSDSGTTGNNHQRSVSSTSTQPETSAAGQSIPTSPSSNRFKASSLAKAFRRRRRSSASTGDVTPPGSQPTSPQVGEFGANDAPPVPPKDQFQRQPDNGGLFGQSSRENAPYLGTPLPITTNSTQPGLQHHSSGGISYIPQSVTPARQVSANTIESQEMGLEKVLLQPSPSASHALSEVRRKQGLQENEIQEKFRRDEEERERGRRGSEPFVGSSSAGDTITGGQHTRIESMDEDEGLPYDRPSRGDPELQHRGIFETSDPVIVNGSPHDNIEPNKDVLQVLASPSSSGALDHAAAERLAAAAESHAARVKAERELEESRIENEKQELNRQRLREIASIEAQRVQAEKVKQEEERERLQQIKLEDERQLRLQQEQEREKKRIQAEAEEKQQAEELERQRRVEETRKAEEMERARIEAEKKRKLAVRDGLMKAKSEGTVMLSGWVTVQTLKSMTWRRRWFKLGPSEMMLYKAEGDVSPIQSVPLGAGAKLSDTYEESQVIGSFKLVASNEEEFYMFADSSEDREVVLVALDIALTN